MLSDIHANWPALEAVLQNEGSWDGVAFCGDVVGPPIEPSEPVGTPEPPLQQEETRPQAHPPLHDIMPLW